MKALFDATDLRVIVDDSDKEKNKLECVVDEYKRPRVILKILDEVVKSDCFEESGFHMQCWPPNVSSRASTKIYLYLSKERWNKLLTEYDPEVRGGFFDSRCKYDRFHIVYYFLPPQT